MVKMGRKSSKKMAAAEDNHAGEGETVQTEAATFRVFDMGRWKEARLCLVCKRQFTWRKKWERCWGEVTTCSERCKQERKKERRNTGDHNDCMDHVVNDVQYVA